MVSFQAFAAAQIAITPAIGLKDGKPFDVLVGVGDGATCSDQPINIETLGGSGIVPSNPRPESTGCTLVVTLTIATSATAGVTSILVKSSKGNIGRVNFTVAESLPGPSFPESARR